MLQLCQKHINKLNLQPYWLITCFSCAEKIFFVYEIHNLKPYWVTSSGSIQYPNTIKAPQYHEKR